MRAPSQGGFVEGLVVGAVGTLVLGMTLIYVLDLGRFVSFEEAPEMRPVLDWLQVNLGLSLPVFAALLLLFVHGLTLLGRRLDAGAPVDLVAQAEQLVDIWTGLFFGTGVLWTAIGMRSALVHALADPEAVASAGAYKLLERMVEGGILIALTTTIVGGIGGYLMRIVKALAFGARLQRYYERSAGVHGEAIETTLHDIERHLRALRTAQLAERDDARV
jgi:hypothetical protein